MLSLEVCSMRRVQNLSLLMAASVFLCRCGSSGSTSDSLFEGAGGSAASGTGAGGAEATGGNTGVLGQGGASSGSGAATGSGGASNGGGAGSSGDPGGGVG